MNISGHQKTSLIDYPGKVSSVIFTSNCNFYCPFCHNPDLIKPQLKLYEIPEKDILNYLKKRKKIIDGLVITGGEPTIQPDLVSFIEKVKKEGFFVKLDTNGTNPEVLKKLFKKKLLDYVAMDIKSSEDKYQQATRTKVDVKKIKESIELIKKSGIDYEFRATIVPTLHTKKEIEGIGKLMNNVNKFYVQQFRPVRTLDPEFENIIPYDDESLKSFARILNKYIKNVEIRGL